MSIIPTLVQQTNDVYNWTNRILKSVPFKHWDSNPEVLRTSINWQVGHLIVSHYYHSVWVIKGMQMSVFQKIPLKEYGNHFTSGNPENTLGKFDAMTLKEQLKWMQNLSIETLESLPEEELTLPLEATGFPHPIATTKIEAIEWNIQHTMYHCGQIGLLARILHERFDFGKKF